MHQSRTRRILFGFFALAIFDAALWHAIFTSRAHADEFALYFLDVGQGDSQLIMLPGDVQVLIDGGQPNGKVLEVLSQILPPRDRYIDVLVMTHPQADHFGGLIDVMERYDVGVFISSGRGATIASYKDLERIRTEHKIPYVAVGAGDVVRIGGATLAVLAPNRALLTDKEVNESSVVMKLSYQGLTALYTGDIGAPAERFLSKLSEVDVDVLKVPHHGSRFSSSADFLSAVSPKIAVIGVGKNSYGHPTPAALDRLEKAGARIFRTDTDGTVRIELRDGKVLVHSKK